MVEIYLYSNFSVNDDIFCMLPKNKFNLFIIFLGLWMVFLAALTFLDFIFQNLIIFSGMFQKRKIRNGDFGDNFIIAQVQKNLEFLASQELSVQLLELNYFVCET